MLVNVDATGAGALAHTSRLEVQLPGSFRGSCKNP